MFHWNVAMLMCLHLVEGYFCMIMAKLSGYDCGQMGTNPRIFTVWPLKEKLPTKPCPRENKIFAPVWNFPRGQEVNYRNYV